MSWMVLYFHSNLDITAFTISGNGTRTDGASVLQGENLKLTCSSSRTDIIFVDWSKKPRGNSAYQTAPSVSMKMNLGGMCSFNPKYPVPANMKCDCVSISKYTCILISVQAEMRDDMWRCRFTYGLQASAAFEHTNDLTIDLTVDITSTVISSPIVNPVSVIVNTTGTFLCETSPGNPVATVVWYKDNTTSTNGNDTQITSGTNTSSTPDGHLIVTHGTLTLQVQRDDQDLGVYCRARNREQWFTSGTKKINVLYGPKMRTLKDVSVIRGEKFEYPCLYEPGNPTAVFFEWTRAETIAPWTKQNAQNLTISVVQRSDETSYTCNVSSVLLPTLATRTTRKYDTATFYLDVMYGAENLKFLLNNVSNTLVEIEEHSTNNLQCLLESDPASIMFIVKDGKTILERPGVHQLIHEMTAKCSDMGVYTCSGYNQYGTAENASVGLFVKCSARQPPGVDAKLNYTARPNENVTMSYTIAAYPVPKPSKFVWKGCINESEDSCNSSLDGKLKFDVTTEGLSSSLTIRDVKIEDYGMYQFSVYNGIGSRFIEWLHLKPIGKPDSPSDFHVIQEEIYETSAVLTWTPSSDNGSPQMFYITYTKKGDQSGWIKKSIEYKRDVQMNYTLRNLEPETEYIVSIYASNEKGFSPTINDTFMTLKHIPGKHADSQVALIGGSIGGGIAVVLVAIGVILILKKFRTSGYTKNRDKLTKRTSQLSSQQKKNDDNPAGQSISGKDNRGFKGAQTYEQLSMATYRSVYDALDNEDNGTDSPGCKAANTYEELSKRTDTSVYDALKKGDNGSGTDGPRCNAAQTYEELSMKTEKGDNGPDNSQVYTPLDTSKSQSHMYFRNAKQEDPVYNDSVL
ncbi:titin-like [Mya arenaria]|uniref:titin-like n=1 Tax=Mya arenaria TaxID=6604 RepID=UPI0022E1D25F|nr:titin-like [Mya arenaria]